MVSKKYIKNRNRSRRRIKKVNKTRGNYKRNMGGSKTKRKATGEIVVPNLSGNKRDIRVSLSRQPESSEPKRRRISSGVVASPSALGVVASPSASGVVASPSASGVVASPSALGVVASPSALGLRITPFMQARSAVGTQLMNPSQRQSNMLKKVCNADTRGSCLDFGVYREQIKIFFNDYLLNPYAKSIRRIGQPSSNGFILQVSYERDGYKAYSAIKCNKPQRDNLLYEYFVGRNYINELVPIFPCFIETYNQLYFFNRTADYFFAEGIRETSSIKMTDDVKMHFREETNVKGIMEPLATFANNACKFGKRNSVAIMLQHYDNFISIKGFENIPNVNTNDMPNILLQIYFVLNVLKDEYTHYDLHASNAFLYKPYVGQRYIEMTYHFNDGSMITFPTEYIAKIIDYGRNFFDNTKSGVKSQDLFDKLCYNCEAPECVPKVNPFFNVFESGCGPGSGIYYGEYGYAVGSGYFISPNKRNASHDLRLLITSPLLQRTLSDLNVNPVYQGFGMIYSNPYGTKEKLDNNFSVSHKICNVRDMLIFLKEKVPLWNVDKFAGWSTKISSPAPAFNKYTSPWIKMGVMHIYEDRRPYEFIASTI